MTKQQAYALVAAFDQAACEDVRVRVTMDGRGHWIVLATDYTQGTGVQIPLHSRGEAQAFMSKVGQP